MYNLISDAEILYTKRGCNIGIRRDGRGLKDFRDLQIEDSVLPQVNGSAHVRLGNVTEVICSVKLDISEPVNNVPDRGLVTFSLDFSPSCRLDLDDRHRTDLSKTLAERLQNILLGSSSIDLESLCIIRGKYCWLVHIDVLVYQLDGDPLDICSIASYVALKCTRVPKVELILGGTGAAEDFQICSDTASAVPLKIRDMPICITVVKMGSQFVLDANAVEHASASCAFVIALDQNAKVCAFFKSHGEDSVSISDVSVMLEVSEDFAL